MILELFKKQCPVCGKDIEKKFSKYFSSPEHTEKYQKQRAEQEAEARSRSKGCCGA